MSLQFTVSGSNIRTFLSVLLCVGKLGDAVYLLAYEHGIELSAVTQSRNSHIAVRIHRRCFDTFAFTPSPPSNEDNDGLLETANGNPPPSSPPPPSSSSSSSEFFLCLLTKTLMVTVLRQHNNNSVQSIDFTYSSSSNNKSGDGASQNQPSQPPGEEAGGASTAARPTVSDERADVDVVRWHCTYARGVTKTFLLRLAEGYPTDVRADARRYHFEVCGDARLYGSLLASLPNTTAQCGLTLLESGGMELRSVNNTNNSNSNTAATSAKKQSASAAAMSKPRSSGHGAADADAAGADGALGATVVTAFAGAFSLYRFFHLVELPTRDESMSTAKNDVSATQDGTPRSLPPDTDTSSGPSHIAPTPTPTDPPPVLESPQRRVFPYLPLPGKVFDVKPFKQAAWLAEQLGVQLRVRCGDVGTPLIFSSITPEEVQAELSDDAAEPRAGVRDERRDSGRRPPPGMTLVGRGAAGGGDAAGVPACIAFTVHVAALDTPAASASALPGAPGANAGPEMTVATAVSSAVNTPRTSGHLPASHTLPQPQQQQPQEVRPALPPSQGDHRGGGEGGAPTAAAASAADVRHRGSAGDGADFVAASPPFGSSTPLSLPASATNSATAARDSSGLSQAGAVVDVDATPWPAGSRDSSQQHHSRASENTPSHVDASFSSATPQRSLEHLAGPSTVTEGRGLATAGAVTVTPRHSLSSASDLVMVMTAADSQDARLRHSAVMEAPAALPLQPSVHGSGPASSSSSSSSYTAATLTSMYPLDFEAFARTYTTQQDLEEEEDDAQDAELRDFLASCVASMSRGPTQN